MKKIILFATFLSILVLASVIPSFASAHWYCYGEQTKLKVTVLEQNAIQGYHMRIEAVSCGTWSNSVYFKQGTVSQLCPSGYDQYTNACGTATNCVRGDCCAWGNWNCPDSSCPGYSDYTTETLPYYPGCSDGAKKYTLERWVTSENMVGGWGAAARNNTGGCGDKSGSCYEKASFINNAVQIPSLSVSCSANPSSINTNQSTTFSASASGGTGSYTYSWSGACTGSSQSCSNTFSSAGTKTATVAVTSGLQTASANCSVNVSQAVINHDHKACFENDVYWYGSNDLRNDIYQDCTGTQMCQNAQCVNVSCNSNSDCGTNGLTGSLFCQGNNVYQNYITYTCNNPGTANSSCTNFTTPQLQTTCTGNQICSNGCCTTSCTLNYQQKCVGNNLYWYDSCGTQGNLIQYCPNGCSGNACQGNICTQNAYQRCSGNNLYWYDSCGNQGNLIQYCPNGCYNNSCQTNVCTYHSYERCSGNNLYWYDSCGTQQDLSRYCPNGCYNNSCQDYGSATLTVDKTVKNLTSGSGFSTSTYANPSDMLMFMITLRATGNQNVQNVLVRDMLGTNLIYNDQLIIACTTSGNVYSNCSGGNYNYSGSITSGINLSTIYAGQTVTITYQVQVAGAQNFSYGTTTLNNNVSVTSSAYGYTPTNNASVIVTRSTVLGASTISTGLTNNFWLDSFILPLLVALIGIWMWRAGMFFGIEKWLDNKKKMRRGYKAEKELLTRIKMIKNS